MRIKLNDGYIYHESTYEPSDLYRRFMPCFDFLLASENNSAEYIENCYVSCELDQDLKEVFLNRLDGIYNLIGYTGIGKTTMICQNFGLTPNKNNAVIKNKALIIPVFFDADRPSENDIDDKLIRKIKSVIKLIKYNYPLEQNNEAHDEDLYNFILQTKAQLLEYNINSQRIIENIDEIKSSLDALWEQNKLAYYLCDLKMNIHRTDIETVLVILDDLETQPIDSVMHIISEYYHIFECLKNNDHRKYKVKLLLSTRPHTLRYLNSQEEYKRTLEAYGISKEFSILSPPNIVKIFEKRFLYATTKSISNGELIINNITSWKNAYNVLEIITKKIDLDFGDVLYKINHYNIRETLTSFIKLLCNRKWLQKWQSFDSSFILNYEDFITSKSAVLKSLIYGNNTVYVNNTTVPNILFNDYDNSNELYALLVLKYFIKRSAVTNYGFNNVDISCFLENCEKLWESDKILDIFISSVNYFLDKKILLHSVLEKEYKNKKVKKNDKRKLYLSSKGQIIWEMLNNDSVLFEAYREDIYREESEFLFREYNINLQQEQILEDCLCYLKSIAKKEIEIRNMFINEQKGILYNKLFGSVLVTQHIFNGIENTINYYFKAHNRETSETFKEILAQTKKIFMTSKDLC